MKLLPAIAFLLSCFATTVSADSIFFIQNRGAEPALASSWGFYKGGSFVELAEDYGEGEGKFPVGEPSVKGQHSLRLRWRSVSEGDWGVAAAGERWEPYDMTAHTELRFKANGPAAIRREHLPDIALEDTSNRKSSRVWVGDFFNGLNNDPEAWQAVSIPLAAFQPGLQKCDLTRIKTIFFFQRLPDGAEHEMWIDDLRAHAPGTELQVPLPPTGIRATGHHLRVDLRWTPDAIEKLRGYRVYASSSAEGPFLLVSERLDDINLYSDFIGTNGVTRFYRVSSVNAEYDESEMSDVISGTTRAMNDEELLTSVQEAAFRYFWDFGHPVSGLAREASDFNRDLCTIGGSGFGLMNIVVGVERNFITRDEAVERLLKIMRFLDEKAIRHHGAWSHHLNGATGEIIPFSNMDDGVDIVETAFMVQGLLTARAYFDRDTPEEVELRKRATDLWESVKWSAFQRDKNDPVLHWHWSPTKGFELDLPVRGFNECMIVYLLAIASPSYPVPPKFYYDGWANNYWYENGRVYYGHKIWVGPDHGGPLFFTHYSFLGFDPRNKRDRYCNYFENSRNIALVHQAYCAENPKGFKGYSSEVWGMTASRNPFGYAAHAPGAEDNGTITPTAALSSMPYTPDASMAALRRFYEEYGSRIWGPFGFTDAFNPNEDWYADGYLAIDQGTIAPMIENHRTGLCWDKFMANPEIQPMLDAIGWEAE